MVPSHRFPAALPTLAADLMWPVFPVLDVRLAPQLCPDELGAPHRRDDAVVAAVILAICPLAHVDGFWTDG